MFLKKTYNITRSLTFRLTVWYITIFFASWVVISIVVYYSLSSRMHQRVDNSLTTEANEYAAVYRAEGKDVLSATIVREAPSGVKEDIFVRVLNSDGSILAQSDSALWKNIRDNQESLNQLSDGKIVFRTLAVAKRKHPCRVGYLKLADGTLIQVGVNLRDDDRELKDYREVFGFVILAILFPAGFFGWWMAHKSMAGIGRLRATAMRVGEGEFSQRANLNGNGDEIDQLAMTFNVMLEQIDKLVAELKEVTNNIAHDLRSPITRMRGLAENALTMPDASADAKDLASIVVEESDRLVVIINTMLEIAENESGLVTLDKQPINLCMLASQAHELFLPVAEDKHVVLKLIVPQAPIMILGDKARLQRVVANLVDNAVKFTLPAGAATISVRALDAEAMIVVEDTGIGINAKDLPQLFKRFYRCDRSRSQPGNGLGLSLAQSMVHMHGGWITVTSKLGRGSKFEIHLPL